MLSNAPSSAKTRHGFRTLWIRALGVAALPLLHLARARTDADSSREAWSPETQQSNEISWDGVFAEHERQFEEVPGLIGVFKPHFRRWIA
jgi:hypothetical protein